MKRIEWCGIVGFLLAGCVAASPGAAVRASADGGGELRAVIDQVQSDRGALGRFFDVEGSTARIARLRLNAEEARARVSTGSISRFSTRTGRSIGSCCAPISRASSLISRWRRSAPPRT